MTDEILKQGIAALKAGRKAEARSFLMQVVEQDERNEMAWLWLSGAKAVEPIIVIIIDLPRFAPS